MIKTFVTGGPTKEIVESIVTGSLSPDEMLEQLDSYGIEWYLTEKGDLLIRNWQVVAEEFVPSEHVGRILEGRSASSETGALEWLSTQLPNLKAKYAGQWIAIAHNRVVAASSNLPNLLQHLRDSGVEHPFVTEIPERPLVWTTAYARYSV